MKKFIFVFVLGLVSIMSYAQVSYGKFVMFPNDKLTGAMWKPQLNFTNVDGKELICLRSVASDTYYSFDNDSRILLRFADSTVVKLPLIEGVDVQKDYSSKYIVNSLTENYITYSFYEIDETTINKICNDKINIIKVRCVYSNGTIRDYEIDTKYMKTFIEKLIYSRNDAAKEYEIRKNNMNDDDF